MGQPPPIQGIMLEITQRKALKYTPAEGITTRCRRAASRLFSRPPARSDLRKKAIKAGAAGLLRKPYTAEDLVAHKPCWRLCAVRWPGGTRCQCESVMSGSF